MSLWPSHEKFLIASQEWDITILLLVYKKCLVYLYDDVMRIIIYFCILHKFDLGVLQYTGIDYNCDIKKNILIC